jgi:hypothetical protein
MNNLTKKSLIESTVFQYGMILNIACMVLYACDLKFTAADLVGIWTMTFGAYVAKEGVAKGAEAYRDKGAP